jgi:CTP:molybdopterin cytidylyltransferase MocA
MKTPPTIIVLGAGRGTRYTGPRHKLAESLGADSVLKRTVSNALAPRDSASLWRGPV